MTAAATWETVAATCRLRQDAADLLGRLVTVPSNTPPWWAKSANARIRDAYQDLALVFADLADEASEFAISAAEHEAVA